MNHSSIFPRSQHGLEELQISQCLCGGYPQIQLSALERLGKERHLFHDTHRHRDLVFGFLLISRRILRHCRDPGWLNTDAASVRDDADVEGALELGPEGDAEGPLLSCRRL